MSTDIAIDAIASVAASTVQFGRPQPAIILPVIAADVLYTGGIAQWIEDNYSGEDGALRDAYTRDIAAKSAIATGLSFFANQFLEGDADILGTLVNAVVTFAAGNGIRETLDLV